MSIRQDIGIVTAYGYAVSKGYQGTEEEFAEAMAAVGTNVDEITDAIDTFINQTVPAATQAVTDEGIAQIGAVNQAGADQVDAVEDKGTIEIGAVEAAGTMQIGLVNGAGTTQVNAVNGAGTTQVGLVNSAGTTQVGNVNTAGSTQVAAVNAKGEEVIQSIPADYSALTQEVSDLDETIIQLWGDVFDETNLLYLNDIEPTTINGLTYSLKDGLLSISGTTDSATTILIPIARPISAGSYKFNNFITYQDASEIGGSFSFKTIGNQYIALPSGTNPNYAITITSDVPAFVSIYFGSGKTLHNTYRFCVTPSNVSVYPEAVAADKLKTALDTRYALISDLSDYALEADFEELHDDIFVEEHPNLIRYADKGLTDIGNGLSYSITDGIVEITGTSTSAGYFEIPLLADIPAGNYYFNNFITYPSGDTSSLSSSVSFKTAGNQFITLAGNTDTNKEVTITSDKPVSIYFYIGSNKVFANTYHFCLTDEALSPVVYPDDTIEIAETLKVLLDERYKSNNDYALIAYGDSLTQGSGSSGIGYRYLDRCKTALNAKNDAPFGYGGSGARAIAFTAGAISAYIPPSTNSFALKYGDFSTNVTIALNQLNGKKVIIDGTEYTISQTADNAFSLPNTYTPSSYYKAIVVKNSRYTADVYVIWVGTNDNGYEWDIIDAMIAKLPHKNYVVMGLTRLGTDTTVENERKASEKYGSHFFNTRVQIINNAFPILGITPTAEDTTAMSAGLMPPSLLSDSVHFNDDGYEAIGKLLAEHIKSLGYEYQTE